MTCQPEPAAAGSGDRRRPVVAVLCERAADRPPGLDGLGVEFRYCDADGLAEAIRGARALLLWDFFSTAVSRCVGRGGQPRVDSRHRGRRRHPALRRAAGLRRGGDQRPRESSTGRIAEYVLGAVIAACQGQPQQPRSAAATPVAASRDPQDYRRHGAGGRHRGDRPGDRQAAARGRAGGSRARAAGRVADDPDFGEVDSERQPGRRGRLVRPPDPGRAADRRRPAAWSTPKYWRDEARRAPGQHRPRPDGRRVRAARRADRTPDRRRRLSTSSTPSRCPPDHPLWDAPNVTITAHMSGDVVGWRDTLAAQFAANVRRWLAGEPLLNVVDKKLGYIPAGGATR